MTIYGVADMLTGLIEAIMMLMLCEALLVRRENLPKWGYAAVVAAETALINLSNAIFQFAYMNTVVMILSFWAMSFLYLGKRSARIITALLNTLMICTVEVTVLYGLCMLYGISVADVVSVPAYRMLGIILSKMLSLFAVNLIRVKFKKQALYMNSSYWLLLLIMFLSSITTTFLIFKLSFDIKEEYLFNLSIIYSFGIIFSTFFALFLYEHLAKQAQTIRKQERYEQDLKTQLTHLDDILITQKQLKGFKHDYGNFQIGLQAYLDNNDINGAKEYLSELQSAFKSGGAVLETGNTALDAILNTKLAIAKSKGIKVETKLQIPENIAVEPIDICVIFGNALDNAIEACERVGDKDKRISISVLCRGNALLCRIVNSAAKADNLTLSTSKADKLNHGFGLENIKTALEKYNSSPIVEMSDTEFVLKFVIFTKE